jgi:dolichol kinase
MVRLLKLGSVGESLQQGFLVFADEKDQGGVSLTPLYLLVGCSAPLWLHPSRCTLRASLPMLAGLLSVGAGDTAASVIGFSFGKHKWQGT